MLRVKSVKHIKDYKLEIVFSDGKAKVVDFQNWINEGGFYFLPMKDLEFFKKVEIDESNYSICWPNGADVSPDAMYEIGVTIGPEIEGKAVVRHPIHALSKRKPKKQ